MTASVQKQKSATSGIEYLYIVISYKDPLTLKHKTKKVSTGLIAKNNKRKAQAMIPDVLEQYAYLEERRLPERNILLCDYLRSWMRNKKIEIKSSTYEAYAYRMEKIIEFFEPREYRVRDITPGILDQYFRWCLAQGKVSQKDGSRSALSVRSVRSYKSLLNAVFDQAMIDGLVLTNPVLPITIHGKRNRDYAEQDLFLTKEETEAMLRFLDGSAQFRFLKPIAFIAVYFGLRRSELLGLTWDAVDFESNLLRIQQTVVRVKTCEVSDITKTPAGRRDLGIFPLAAACLKEVYNRQEQNRAFLKKGYQNAEGYVFVWDDGRPYSPDYLSRTFRKAMTAFGKPTITLHKLRHTCASFLIEKGWDVKQVQYWMGHEDIQTTLDIYAHYNKKRMNASQMDLADISAGVGDLFTAETDET